MSRYVHGRPSRLTVGRVLLNSMVVLGIIGLSLIMAAAYGFFIPACREPTRAMQYFK